MQIKTWLQAIFQAKRRQPVLPVMLLFVLLLGTAGCANLGVRPGAAAEKSALPSSWQLRGKLASRGMGAAGFTWQQTRRDSTISISAPLGAGAARIKYVANRIAVNTGKVQLGHEDAVQWLQLQGLAVPFDALAWWVQGLPVPRLPRQWSGDGRSFVQAGWTVTLRKLVMVDCLKLPSRLTIGKGDTLLKLGGLQWQWRKLNTATGPSLFSNNSAQECADE